MTGIDPAMFGCFGRVVASPLRRRAGRSTSSRIRRTPHDRTAHAGRALDQGACRISRDRPRRAAAHVMEDALVAAQHGKIRLTPGDIDTLLKGSDVLASLGDLTPGSAADWGPANATAVARLEPVFIAMTEGTSATVSVAPLPVPANQNPSPTVEPDTGGDFPPLPLFEPIAIPPEPLPLPLEHSMLDLFREELREHLLLVVARGDAEPALESLKQIRGAARIVKCEPIERVAIALSAFLSAVREGRVRAYSGRERLAATGRVNACGCYLN